MRQGPLQETLKLDPDLGRAATKEEALRELQAMFVAARGDANAYVGERIEEIYELTERAMTLGASYPPPAPEERPAAMRWAARIPGLIGRYGGGLLLAGMAPLVYEDSVLLSAAAAIAAVLMLTMGGGRKPLASMPKPKATAAKFNSLASAADKALNSMTAQRALPPPAATSGTLPEEDMLSFLQDALMLSGDPAADEAAQNAERLVERAGYRVVRQPGSHKDMFEIMVDPEIAEEIVLKPALIHRQDPSKLLHGVIVKGRN